jgi:hypothetical protein
MSIDNPPPAIPEVPSDPTAPEPFAPTPDEPSPFVSGSPAGVDDDSSGVDDELTPSNVDPDIDPDPS